MMPFNPYLFSVLFLTLLTSCQTSDDFISVLEKIDTGIYAAGVIREEGQSEFSNFRIDVGDVAGSLSYIFWLGDISQGTLGTTYILGAYPSELINSRPLFGLQFWSESLPDDRSWTKLELENFFSPGNSFSFGRGFGKVELLLQIPLEGPYFNKASRPSYLENPQGTLTIIELTDYDYETYYPVNGHSYGKLVRCTFSGQLGKYDHLADQADGDPDVFITDEVVELRNGEALFYVEYDKD